MPGNDDLPHILQQARDGDPKAADQLIQAVYTELRELTRRMMRRERAGHTLQPTALVHEVYLKLVGQQDADWRNRAHFVAVAAQVIRRILIDHARNRASAKRGGGVDQVEFDENLAATFGTSVDVLALHDALELMARTHPRHAQIVESRFFGGLTIEDTAAVLGVSTATVERQWRFARAWLFKTLRVDGDHAAES